jgi:hypothetical protein
MSLWDSFLDNIAKPVAKNFASGLGQAANFAGQAFPIIPSPSTAISNIVIPAAIDIGVSPILSKQGLTETAQQGIKENLKYATGSKFASNDLTLKIAHNVVEPVISKGIARPIGTIGLLTDPNSELYQPNEFESGFQVSDIRAAYNRTEKVTAFQALTKSALWDNPYLPNPLQAAVGAVGNIDFNSVNLWDDADIQKNFSDNIVGRYYTGIGDFVVVNAAISAVGGGISGGALAAGKLAGLSSRGKALTTFEKELSDGLSYFDSNGTTGKFSNSASDVKFLAETKDINQIINRLDKYTTNPRMIDAIYDASDPRVVADLILADKGYAPALERLVTRNPAAIGDAAGVQYTFANKAMDNSGVYHPEGDALDRINALYDDAIKLPEHKKYYETVMDPQSKSFLGGGRDYFPMEPKLGAEQLAALKNRVTRVKGAAVTRDFTDIGGFEERILGNRLVTRAIHFTGTYKPLSYVTFSGARPLDGIVELHAFFDDFKLFENGTNRIFTTPTKSVSASEYRNNIITNFVKANSNIERKKILDDFDIELGRVLAFSNKFYDVEAIDNFTRFIRTKVATSHNTFAEKGMGIDAQGRRTTVNPETQRQLIESMRLSPWNIVEKEIIKASESGSIKNAQNKLSEASKAAFETVNRYWTFDVLARPSYIPKQSLGEPMLSAFLANGLGYIVDGIPTMTKNSIKNNRNRAMQAASRIHSGPELKAIQKIVDEKSSQLDIAVTQLDALNAEHALFFETDKISPAARAYNGPKVIKDLKAAQKLVDDIELDLMAAIKPFGKMEPVPTFAGLERRIKYLEGLDSGGKYGTAISNAKYALGAARGQVHTLIPNPAKLIEVNKDIAKQYSVIQDSLKELGESYFNEAQLLGKSAKYKKRYYGKEVYYKTYDGKQYNIDALTNENQYGLAFKEELSNSGTVATTYLNELNVGTRQSIIMRKAPGTITDVNSPLYFEELAYVVNRSFRGDPLVDQILSGVDPKTLVKWGESPSGMAYMEQFGAYTAGQVPDFIRSRISFVNRYLPNKEAQALALKGEVTSVQLQSLMSKNLDELSAIHPTDFNYQAAAEGLTGVRGLSIIDKFMSDVARKTFKALAAPENPIRWQFADKAFVDVMMKKIKVLADQGIEVTDVRMNALRQAASREAIAETEKTFYTIRRQNRGLYAARVASAFPSASLNAFYRYGRMAIKNPTRVAGFLHSYNSTFKSFGIDKYGNPVENPLEATHLVLPGSKDIGLFSGKGVRLSARSLGFLLNLPGPSYFAAVPLGKLMEWKPNTEDTLKNVLGSNYDVFFPYGPTTVFAPKPLWLDNGWKYLNGPESNADFLNSVKSVSNYYHTLDEMGIQKFPGDDVVRQDAKNLYGVKAQWTFASPFGVPVKVDTDPMKIFEDYYSILTNKWIAKGNNATDAKALAGEELLATLGTDFQLDRITYKGSPAKAYVQSNLSSFNRVFKENNDLVSALANLNPKMIELLTLDLPYKPEEFNLSIYKILNDPKTKLPGNVLYNDMALNAKQEESKRQINRTWIKYNDKRDKLNSLALSAGKPSLNSIPKLKAELEEYARTVLGKENPQWFDEWAPKEGAKDIAYPYANALEMITTNVKFMAAHGQSKLWQDAQNFLYMRNVYVNMYQSLPDYDPRKKNLKAAYLNNLNTDMSQWEKPLQELISRYFINDSMTPTEAKVN